MIILSNLQTLQTDKETEVAHHEDEVHDLVERQNTELQDTGKLTACCETKNAQSCRKLEFIVYSNSL